MRRNVLSRLHTWKNKQQSKPLLLRGARQVGKTWIIREFGKSYSSFVEINLEQKSELIPLFDKNFGHPLKLIEQLSLVLGVKIIPNETLLFIDEIQESPSALKSLRYFYEEYSNQHVVAAGSLLEFTLKEISFPVGRIEFLYLFPMNFYEYLDAIGDFSLVEFLEKYKCTKDLTLISDELHDKLLNEIKNYCFIGGMPEVVKKYVETGNFKDCFEIQGDLINNFRFDFNKYASKSKVPYLRILFDSVPKQFAKKFIYANIAGDAKSRELSQALHLLSEAGLIYICYHTSGNGVPLSAEINLKKFKVYHLDIGLALRALGFNPHELPTTSLTDLINQGGLMEQFVCQELISKTEKGSMPGIYYWQREELNASAEIDFLINRGKDVIPVEVKSGRQRFSKSLGLFIKEKRTTLAYYISSEKSKILSRSGDLPIVNLSFYEVVKILGSDHQINE